MSKLLYTCFTKLIINHFLSCNKNIPSRSDSEMHSEGDDSPLTKLSNTINDKFKFGMKIPNTMINDAFKKSAGYKYYKAKKVESEKAKVVVEPEEQHVSPVKHRLGKGYMRSGKQEANIPIMFKKNVVPRKTRSLSVADNIVEEPVVVELAKSICIEEQRRKKLKGPEVEDPAIQSLLDIHKGSKASRLESMKQMKQAITGEGSSVAHNKYYEFENISATNSDATQDSSRLDTNEEKDVETDDSEDSNLDLSEDEPRGDDDATEYDQKLEALTSINVSKAIDKAFHAKVMTKMKKLTPIHVPKVLANYVKPRLNNFVLEVMQNNQISLFTKPSTSVDDILDIDLKLKLLNRIHENKTDPTNQKLYDTLYASILFDQEALDAQEAAPSILKWTHDHQDSPTNHLEGGGLEKLKLHYKNDVELEYHVDQLKAAVLFEAQWNSNEGAVSKPRSFERHMSKSSKPHPNFYNNDFYYLAYLRTEEKYTTSLTKHYATRQDFFKAEINKRTSRNVYSDKKIILVVRVVVKRKWGYGFLSLIVVRRLDKQEHTFSYADLPRLNLNEIEDMYLLKVQDKMHHLPLDDEKDFNNALILFIRRTVIKNIVEDL
ncbi:hypothetical protein Tco_1502673 [Tanacetum coccineum]